MQNKNKGPQVTHVRIKKTDKALLDTLKRGDEDMSLTMHRLLKDYRKRGISREIVKMVDNLQHLSVRFIHEDFHEVLELIKVELIRAHRMNQDDRARIALILKNRIQSSLGQFDDENKEKEGSIEKTMNEP